MTCSATLRWARSPTRVSTSPRYASWTARLASLISASMRVSAQNDIMIIPNANHRLSPDDVEASLRALRDQVSVVLVQLEIPLAVVQRVAEVCQDMRTATGAGPGAGAIMPAEVWRGRLRGQAERARGGGADRHFGHRISVRLNRQRAGSSTAAPASR